MLDLIAHPIALWALGLFGSLTRTLLRKHKQTGRRVMPWDWIMEHPGQAVSAVVGSVILLAIFQRADLLDGDGITPAMLALGAGALGPEALPLIIDKSKAVARKAADRKGWRT